MTGDCGGVVSGGVTGGATGGVTGVVSGAVTGGVTGGAMGGVTVGARGGVTVGATGGATGRPLAVYVTGAPTAVADGPNEMVPPAVTEIPLAAVTVLYCP